MEIIIAQEALLRSGQYLGERGQHEQAEALYLRMLRLREGAVGESELTVAQTLSDLALHYQVSSPL